MAAALAQRRAQHEEALAEVCEQLARLDAQRPALALDDPMGLARLDEDRARLQSQVDRLELALEELGRREAQEQEAQAAQQRKALESQLTAALGDRKGAVDAALGLAEALGEAERAVFEIDRKVMALAHRDSLDVADEVRSIEDLFKLVLKSRRNPTFGGPEGERERTEATLAAYLAMGVKTAPRGRPAVAT